jgi:hypothetical protein
MNFMCFKRVKFFSKISSFFHKAMIMILGSSLGDQSHSHTNC